jgi:hypothetical protein
MIKGMKNKMLLMALSFCLTNVVLGQIQTKTDTILCHNKNIIIKYPTINKINIVNYEEGYFKTINCVLDTVIITIHCGSMVNLPLTDSTNKIICSEFMLNKEIRSIRGYYMTNKRKKYFREDNYFKYGITIVYDNVEETRLIYYEHFFNDIKIQ